MAGRRGALIVLEGMDRAGKTTQCRKLVAALLESGQRAELLRFPERSTEIGKLLSSYLEKKSNMEDHTVHLLFSANRWEQNFSIDWCKQPDVGLPKPDLILFLQLSSLEAAKRGDFGTERYENNAFQEKALQCFHHLMQDDSLNWKTIDASQGIEDLHKEIYSLSEKTIQMAQDTAVGELWK
ncbi:thymidylate kinase isoform X2 [Phascolarctos cinereus]|uniref:Thymidylate kinase isoform X2 n=1 Tax=Phascolarctos cinereus TaxID=38626 RepID=A0A6P5KJ81_PHACI|nr:thymidylate kinase isoform X2 [Phascolarctos cinereus]